MFPLPPAVDAAAAAQHDDHGGVPLYMKVWGILLIGTVVEVAMAYVQPKMQLSVTDVVSR